MSDMTVDPDQIESWMRAALQIGHEGVARGENAFGAGVFRASGATIALQHNQAKSQKNPTAHAEVCAIAEACKSLGTTDLDENIWLVATAEPCPMCLSAAALAGIKNVVFGAPQKYVDQAGYGSIGVTGRELAKQLSQSINLHGPVLESEAKELLFS